MIDYLIKYVAESFFFLSIATDKTKNVDKNSRSPDYSSWMEPIQQQFDLYRSHIDGNNSWSDIWDRNIYGIHHVFYRFINWLLYFCQLDNVVMYSAMIWRFFLFHRGHWETMETTLRSRKRRAIKCNNWSGISSCSKFKKIFHICHYKFKIISISGMNIQNWFYLFL